MTRFRLGQGALGAFQRSLVLPENIDEWRFAYIGWSIICGATVGNRVPTLSCADKDGNFLWGIQATVAQTAGQAKIYTAGIATERDGAAVSIFSSFGMQTGIKLLGGDVLSLGIGSGQADDRIGQSMWMFE